MNSFLFAIRSLRARPMRTLLTMFGVVLGVAVILAINIANLSTLDSITTVFAEASGKAHLVVTSSDAGAPGFGEDILRRIAAVPGVRAAVPSLQAQAMLADDTSAAQVGISFLGAAFGGLSLYGIDPAVDLEAREYKIVAGQFLLSDPDAYEIVLVKDYADKNNIRLGRDLDLLTPEGITRVRVVGLMSKEGPGQLNNGAFGALPLRTAQRMFGRAGSLDQIDIVALPQVASGVGLDDLKATLQARLGDKYSVVYPAARGRRVTQMLDGYQMGLNMFSAIALFVGAFLIYNAFSMTVVERTREIGTLRTLGMTRQQIMRQILAEAGMLGVAGALLGVIVGIVLSQGLIQATELVLGQEVKQIRVPPGGLVASLLVGLGVTLAAASLPAWQGSRISPLEAVRIRGNQRESWLIRRGWIPGGIFLGISYILLYSVRQPPVLATGLRNAAVFGLLLGGTLLVPVSVSVCERLTRPLIRRVYGSEGQLGSRNAQRARLRTTLTVAALMVGVAMILSIRAVTSAFSDDIRTWIEKYIGGDAYVHSSLPMRSDLGRLLEGVEGVAVATPIRYFDVKRLKPSGGSESLSFMAVDPESYRSVTSLVFAANQGDSDQLLNRLAEGDTVFLSSVLSEKYGLRQGDTIRLETRRGRRDFQIAAIVVDFYNRGLVVQGSWKDMRRYFDLNDVSAYLLKLRPGFLLEDVQTRIDQLYGQRRHLTVESNQALKNRALELIAQTGSLFDVLALIAMIVAALGVVNTMTMNVLERTQEIGMLRSLGMTRWQVRKMILAEAGLMGFIGGVFGLVFGLFQSRVVLMSINAMAGYELTYVVPVQGIAIGLLIAFVVSQFAAIWPAQRAASIRTIEAIQFE